MKASPTLGILTIALAVAVGLVCYGAARKTERTFYGKLADILPPAPSGWTKTAKPIADTTEMQEAVGELLNFDDGAFVDYRHGADRLSVYIAYWTPGKMSARLVAGHTPDVCWIGGGWKRVAPEATEQRKDRTTEREDIGTSGAPLLQTAERRVFELNGHREHVWFWHVVGERVQSYGNQATPPWYAVFTDLLTQGLSQRKEQFFIRLSSNVPMDSADLAPVLPDILEILPLPARTSS